MVELVSALGKLDAAEFSGVLGRRSVSADDAERIGNAVTGRTEERDVSERLGRRFHGIFGGGVKGRVRFEQHFSALSSRRSRAGARNIR